MNFSFIIIGKNEHKTLGKCFSSIIEFGISNNLGYEIIYVDSQSTDNSYEIARSQENIKAFILDGVCNAARARNLGASKANGDIFCFIDGDMELEPLFGKGLFNNDELIHPFITGYRIDCFYDEDWNYIEDNSKEINHSLNDSYQITTGGLFIIERNLWENIGGIDNRLNAYEDNDLAYRIYKKYNVKILKIGKVYAKHHTVSYTNQKRMKRILLGDSFKYRGVLYRKHFSHPIILYILLKQDLSLIFIMISILLSLVFLDYRFFLIYFVASICRLFFIKNQSDSVSYFKRFLYNPLIDIKILVGFFTFFPINSKPEAVIKK